MFTGSFGPPVGIRREISKHPFNQAISDQYQVSFQTVSKTHLEEAYFFCGVKT